MTRKLLATVIVALLVTACGSGGRGDGGVAGDQSAGSGVPDGPLPTELGVSPGAELLSMTSTELDETLATIASTGARWIRVDIPWPSVQPTAEQWIWDDQDRVVAAIGDHDLDILVVAGYRPDWAVEADGTVDADAYGRFVEQAAERYGDVVDVWELWNEPNLAKAWGDDADPADYADVLRSGHEAVRATDPSATVLTGGLAPATNDGGNMAPVRFLSEVYDNGAAGTFDAVAMHPYGYPALPTDRSTSRWNTWFRLADVRTLLDEHGDGELELWITEFGAPTGDADNAVDEARQAKIIAEGIASWREIPWAGPLFVYSIRDRGTDLADSEENFGLLHVDGSEKPALMEFIDAAAELSEE